jgi:imidazolonepropionase-like amidohydrolase
LPSQANPINARQADQSLKKAVRFRKSSAFFATGKTAEALRGEVGTHYPGTIMPNPFSPRPMLITGFALTSLLVAVAITALQPPRLVPPERERLVFSHITVLNPGVDVRHDQTVIVEDGRITAIRASTPTDPVPLCENCWALPGLIDAHIHTPPQTAIGMQTLFSALYLAHGVTSVRDTGQSDGSIIALRDQIRDGQRIGPNMLMCGPVLEGEPRVWQVGEALLDSEIAREQVEALSTRGVDCIKVYNTLTPDVYASIVETTRAEGLPLIGHVPHAVGLRGVHAMNIQHFTGIAYAHGRPPPLLHDWKSEDLLAMTGPELAGVVDIAQTNALSFTPTLINSSRRLVASDPQRWPRPAIADNLPEYFTRFWDVGMGHPEGEDEIDAAVLELPVQSHIVAQLHAGGIEILAGTDTLMPWVTPGDSLVEEIKLLALAFNDNEAALAAATTRSAVHLGSDEIGQIRVGARADLLILAQDARIDLDTLDDWQFLVADGRLYRPALIEAWLDAYRDYTHGWLYRTVMGVAIDLVTDDYSANQSEH